MFLNGCASPTPPAVADGPNTPPLPTAATELTVLAFGDSLTEGFGVLPEENYPSRLEVKLQMDGYDVQVINGGSSGETSTAALARVDWMLNTVPDLVIVETGANDALRGIDLELTRNNIDEIVAKFTARDTLVIVAGMQIVQNLGEDYTSEFAAIYPNVAEKYDAILIPFVLEGVGANPELNQPDFIHPNAAGYRVMVDHIYPFVSAALDTLE